MPISSENWLGTSSPPSPTPGSGCCSVLCSKISQMCGNACFQCQRDLNGIRVPWPDSWITIRSRVNFRLLLYYIRRESILLGKIWRSKLRILILFKTWKSVDLIIFSLQRKNNFFYVCWIPMHERHASRFCFSIWWTLWKKKKSKPFHAYVVSFPPPLCAYCQRRFTNSKKLLSNVTSVTVIHCYYTYLVRQCAWRFAREAACRSTEEEE